MPIPAPSRAAGKSTIWHGVFVPGSMQAPEPWKLAPVSPPTSTNARPLRPRSGETGNGKRNSVDSGPNEASTQRIAGDRVVRTGATNFEPAKVIATKVEPVDDLFLHTFIVQDQPALPVSATPQSLLPVKRSSGMKYWPLTLLRTNWALPPSPATSVPHDSR